MVRSQQNNTLLLLLLLVNMLAGSRVIYFYFFMDRTTPTFIATRTLNSSFAERVFDILDHNLLAAKQRMSIDNAWLIMQHVEDRFSGSSAPVNPLLLEAEVHHAISGGNLDDTINGKAGGMDSEDPSPTQLKQTEDHEVAQGRPIRAQPGQTVRSSAGDKRRTKQRQSGLVQAATKQKYKYEAFKASIRDRANKMKEIKKMAVDTPSMIAAARGRSSISTNQAPQQALINKMQEKQALQGIDVKPAHWLAVTERSIRRRELYACYTLAPLHQETILNRPGRQTHPAHVSEEQLCQDHVVHIALAINRAFQQGALALMYSVLWNAACPGRIVFHIFHLKDYSLKLMLDFFPNMNYRSYIVDGAGIAGAIRGMAYRGKDLENPLNYVRISLPHMLPECIQKIIYIDTDTLVLGRIEDLFATQLGKNIVGSPEFCEYKLQDYFTAEFWKNQTLSHKFQKLKNACYFNPGVLVIDPAAWRIRKATEKLLHWMWMQKTSKTPLYTLGSLPPFLLVFAGEVASVAKAWNEHDLGCNCGVIPIPSKARLLHWSCGGKPWRRIKSGAPCLIDNYYWQPYDLLGGVQDRNWCDDGDLPKLLQSAPILYAERESEKDVGEVYFEQFYESSRPRRCPSPVRIPGLPS